MPLTDQITDFNQNFAPISECTMAWFGSGIFFLQKVCVIKFRPAITFHVESFGSGSVKKMLIRIRNTGDYIAIYHGTYIRWQTYLNANRMWEVKLIFLVAEKKRDGAVNALHRSNNLHHSIRVHRILSNHLI